MTEQATGTVLVTGASGFVGSAIAATARRAGYTVRVLIRPSSVRTNIDPADDVFVGDLNDPASLPPALDGVRYLVHAAADYRLWARHPGEMERTNVEGTRNLMRAAMSAGTERIVYTSSTATLRPGGNEAGALAPTEAIGTYKRSKVLAERAVEAMIADGLPAVIVHPSTPVGPGDVKPTPTGRIIVEAASGRMPGYVDTGLNLVHVDDVAAGHLAALRRGRIGERYILGGENVLLSQLLADIAALVGRRAPRLRFPRTAIWPVAVVAEALAVISGREPFVSRDALRMAKYRMFFDDRKARAELGYVSRPYREGLADAVAWFRGAGYLT
ncbi:hopanoid-associated sugar epimerase [Enterovirga rhinocerotis]|uniref:Dihydroflavonol-4-reductase n=1 Tax=Enterovirga rhinocerotis TaxID=1339210 RepID=A0A4R7CBK8_9HYPH|nr:hopanoid-associated sugar epimerase [Enterovirga rhinocerotis]TDR94476.1 dihydroflavonol-4-reductase [Enterovirga rhinocerotis]